MQERDDESEEERDDERVLYLHRCIFVRNTHDKKMEKIHCSYDSYSLWWYSLFFL